MSASQPGYQKPMAIENEVQYKVLLKRVEYLMLNVPDNHPIDDPEMAELLFLGNLVADYSDEHYAMEAPSDHKPPRLSRR